MDINLDDLLNDLNKSQEDAAKVGITLDLGVRMAIIAFGKTVEPDEVSIIFSSMKKDLFTEELYDKHRSALEPFVEDVEQRVLALSRTVFSK